MVSDWNIFVWKLSKIAAQKKVSFFADFALKNMVETSVGQISIFWTNEYLNIFVTTDIGRMNIGIYSA